MTHKKKLELLTWHLENFLHLMNTLFNVNGEGSVCPFFIARGLMFLIISSQLRLFDVKSEFAVIILLFSRDGYIYLSKENLTKSNNVLWLRFHHSTSLDNNEMSIVFIINAQLFARAHKKQARITQKHFIKSSDQNSYETKTYKKIK